jgi:hypothetical protein
MFGMIFEVKWYRAVQASGAAHPEIDLFLIWPSILT